MMEYTKSEARNRGNTKQQESQETSNKKQIKKANPKSEGNTRIVRGEKREVKNYPFSPAPLRTPHEANPKPVNSKEKSTVKGEKKEVKECSACR